MDAVIFMDSELQEQYIEKLTKLFNQDQELSGFRVEYLEYNDHTGKLLKEYHIFLRDLLCCKLNIQDEYIFIEQVNKCSPSGFIGSGTYNIDRLIEFSKMERKLLKIPYDVAKKELHHIRIPLSKLYILATGKSWYNTMGFYEEHYVSNKKITDEFISQPTWTPRNPKYVKYINNPMITNVLPSPSKTLPTKTSKSIHSISATKSRKRKKPSYSDDEDYVDSSSKKTNVIRFTIQKTFAYILSRLNDKTNIPRKTELEYFETFINKYYNELSSLHKEKTYDLTYMDEEPIE